MTENPILIETVIRRRDRDHRRRIGTARANPEALAVVDAADR